MSSVSWQKHIEAWSKVLSGKTIEDRLALYASRTLFVQNPETYLKADLQTLDLIAQHIPKALDSYTFNTLPDIFLIDEFQRYPDSAPFLPLLDRRLLPPTATLITLDRKKREIQLDTPTPSFSMTALEKAVLAYYLALNNPNVGDDYSILHCSNRDTFLVATNHALAIHSDMTIGLEDIKCTPILLFNEEDSWSPLIGKRPKSDKLDKLLEKLPGLQSADLELSPEDEQLLGDISQLQTLDQAELGLALLFAGKNGPIFNLQIARSVLASWQKSFGNYNTTLETNINRIHLGLSHLLMQQINIKAGTLSPITADIATDCSEPNCVRQNFKQRFLWGEAWHWGLTSLSIDESLALDGGGVCAEQSSFMSSILKLLGVDYFAVHFTGIRIKNGKRKKKDHRIIFVPEWDTTFSNHKALTGFHEPNGFKGLVYIYHQGNWIFFDNSLVMGNSNQNAAQALLNEFLHLAKDYHFEDQINCTPFSMDGNIESCSEIDFANYKQITFKRK